MKHMVMIKLIEGTDASVIEAFFSALHGLQDELDFMSGLVTGIDSLKEARSWHLSLAMDFDSFEKLGEYQNHPKHVAALTALKPYIESVAAVDFDAGWQP